MEKQIREIIAQHVGGTYEAKQKCAEEILSLFSVVGRSEQLKALLEKLLNENMCSVTGDELIEDALKGF
jgi:Asp/Glu/hydantoin racemase